MEHESEPKRSTRPPEAATDAPDAVAVVVPADQPVITPNVARVLLRILVAARDNQS